MSLSVTEGAWSVLGSSSGFLASSVAALLHYPRSAPWREDITAVLLFESTDPDVPGLASPCTVRLELTPQSCLLPMTGCLDFMSTCLSVICMTLSFCFHFILFIVVCLIEHSMPPPAPKQTPLCLLYLADKAS